MIRILKKLFLSAFVISSFALYALHKPSSGNGANSSQVPTSSGNPGPQPLASVPTTPQEPNFFPPTQAPSTFATPIPSPTTVPTALASGRYKDGTYTGPEINAFYGLVEVQAVIQNGKMTGVQFVEYPNDRRTSVRINNVAIPYLQQEAIQAQDANVDLIGGATLTSEAFVMSLQAALDQAKS